MTLVRSVVNITIILPEVKFDNVTLLLHSDTNSGGELEYQTYHHSAFFYHEDSEEMYVGGTDVVLKLDVDDYHIIEVGSFIVV